LQSISENWLQRNLSLETSRSFSNGASLRAIRLGIGNVTETRRSVRPTGIRVDWWIRHLEWFKS